MTLAYSPAPLIARASIHFYCKSSQEQKDAASQNQAFATNLKNMFDSQFGQSQEINGALQKQLQTLTNQGNAGEGFGDGEEAALRAGSKDNAAQQTVEQQQATGARMAADGADPTSGSVAQTTAEGTNAAAMNDANAQRNITLQNAALAREKVAAGLTGTQSLAGTEASQADSLAGTATNAGGQAYNEVTQAYQPSNFVGNLAGGVLSAGLGAVAGPAGAAVGNALSGAINGGGPDEQPQGGDDYDEETMGA